MKTFRAHCLLSVLVLMSICSLCIAEPEEYLHSPENLHSLVITFSAPTHSSVNLADQLGTNILSALRSQPENIAHQIDASGGGWALTSNLSGVQLAFFASDNPWEIVDHALAVLAKLSPLSHHTKIVPHVVSEYQITLGALPATDGRWKNITFDVSPSLEEYLPHLEASARQLTDLYQQQEEAIRLHTHSTPLMAKVMHWPAFDYKNFFSAKFIGEEFLNSFSQPEQLSYEIVSSPSGIYLILITAGTESLLYQFYEPVNRFANEITKLSQARWSEFQEKAEAVLNEDSRDFRKATLSKAWIKHFNQRLTPAKADSKTLSFARPTTIENYYAMPETFMLSFSRSENTAPRIVATRHDFPAPGLDITIMMQGNATLIDSIKSELNSPARLSFTFSSSQTASNSLSINFYSTQENVPIILQTLYDVISSHPDTLKTGNIDIAIATAGNLPPFVLKGLVESSWPVRESSHHWIEATPPTFADITGLSENDNAAIQRRWKLLTATPRGKTELLARLAIAGRFINSFNLPLSK